MNTTETKPQPRYELKNEERRQLLDGVLQQMGANGWRIENRSDYQAQVAKGAKVHHLLHFFIGLFTLGLWWLFVWLPLIVFGGVTRRIVTVDLYGNTVTQKV